MNFVFIPRLASQGSAFAALSAQWVTALLQVYFAIKILKVRIENPYLLKLGFFAVSVFLLGFLSHYIPYGWKIQMTIMLIAVLISSFGLNLINLPAFLNIIRHEDE